MSKSVLLVFLLLVPPVATAVIAKAQRYPKRFAEVIPGRLYRGGFPTARHIRNLKDDKNIGVVISLTGVESDPKYKQELDAVNGASMQFMRFALPGDGCAEFGDLDRVADALAEVLKDKNGWPVFFHCDAGKQRSNAVLAAYRMKQCGWPLGRAMRELEDHYDLDHEDERELVDHLRQYAQWLVASGWRPLSASYPRAAGP